MTNDLTALLRKAYPQFFLPSGNTAEDDLSEDSLFYYGGGIESADNSSQQYNTLPQVNNMPLQTT
jgi:hypothetical protein